MTIGSTACTEVICETRCVVSRVTDVANNETDARVVRKDSYEVTDWVDFLHVCGLPVYPVNTISEQETAFKKMVWEHWKEASCSNDSITYSFKMTRERTRTYESAVSFRRHTASESSTICMREYMDECLSLTLTKQPKRQLWSLACVLDLLGYWTWGQ